MLSRLPRRMQLTFGALGAEALARPSATFAKHVGKNCLRCPDRKEVFGGLPRTRWPYGLRWPCPSPFHAIFFYFSQSCLFAGEKACARWHAAAFIQVLLVQVEMTNCRMLFRETDAARDAGARPMRSLLRRRWGKPPKRRSQAVGSARLGGLQAK